MVKANDSRIYQLRIDLCYIRPPIWRRILVREDTTLNQLHKIIQVLFDWAGYHLHMFEVYGAQFTDDRESQVELEMRNELRVKIEQLSLQVGSKFIYTYDFGDNWEHTIKVEKILPPDPAGAYPTCLKGKRAGPPEDCGGPWGHAEIVEAIRTAEKSGSAAEDPALEEAAGEYNELLEWVGDYDPEAFDLDAINATLAHLRK